MTGFFSNMPASIKFFNPPAFSIESYEILSSYDDNGNYHSVDDKPALLTWFSPSRYCLAWYFHGSIHRKAGLPPMLNISENSYSTFNENYVFHSYDDMPASIEYDVGKDIFHLSWFKEGLIHRDGDKPAIMDVYSDGSIEETYSINGLQHRGKNLPSSIQTSLKAWKVAGHIHNTEGAGIIRQLSFEDVDSIVADLKTWGLYGVEISEEFFNLTRNLYNKKHIPMWVAFMLAMELISEENILSFQDEKGKWKYEYPASWVIRSLGIADHVFEEQVQKVDLKIGFNNRDRLSRSQLTILMDIVQFEEQGVMTFC